MIHESSPAVPPAPVRVAAVPRLLASALVLLVTAAGAAAPGAEAASQRFSKDLDPVKKFEPNGTGVTSLAFSPDGKTLACGGVNGKLVSWDVATGKEVRRFAASSSMVLSIQFSRDGKRVLTGEGTGKAHVWDAQTDKELVEFDGDGGCHRALFFDDESRVVTGDNFMVVRTWDAKNGQPIKTFEGHQHVVNALAVTADGKRVVSGSMDHTARVWDLTSGEQLLKVEAPADLSGVAVSPDGARLYSGQDRTVIVWDAKTGNKLQTFEDRDKLGVYCMTMSSDGTRLLVGTFLPKARVLDATTGRQLALLGDHTELIAAVAFSPDGRFAATGGGGHEENNTWVGAKDDAVRLWDLGGLTATPVPLAAAPAPAGTGDIFDDEWMSPREPPAVATPVSRPSLPAVGPAGPARRPVPAVAERDQSRQLVKEVFSKELADRSPTSRRGLARRLLDESAKLADAPSDRFVVLGAAIEAAIEAGDLPLAFDAADRVAEAYDLDGLKLKARAALKMPSEVYAANPAQNVDAAAGLLGPLESAEDLAAASRLASLLQKIPGADPLLRDTLKDRATETEARRVARDQLGPAIEKLKTSPQDPAANGAVGRYTALMRGDWEHGLPLLAKGDDAALASLAARDLAGAGDAGAMVKLGDAWAEYGSRLGGDSRACAARARFWYFSAVHAAKGLERFRVVNKLLASPPGPDFGLLKSVWGGTETTEMSGGANNPSEDLPESPGLLIGFEYATSPWAGRQKISTIRPVFLTAAGRSVGRWHGPTPEEETAHAVEARPGYAVGGVSVEAADRVFAIRPRYMRVHGPVLDPNDAYDGAWFGSRGSAAPKDLAGDGRAVVGARFFHGADFEGIGLIQVK